MSGTEFVALVARTQNLAEALPGGLEELDPMVRRRWEKLRRTGDRDDFLAARVLAAEAVRTVLGGSDPVAFSQCCDVCGGPHGRPVVTSHPATVSWSHADGVVAAAARTAGNIGIDAERVIPEERIEGLEVTGRSFVRGEALVKAGALSLDAVLTSSFDWPVNSSGMSHGCHVRDLALGVPGMFAAVAWSTGAEPG